MTELADKRLRPPDLSALAPASEILDRAMPIVGDDGHAPQRADEVRVREPRQQPLLRKNHVNPPARRHSRPSERA